MIDLKTAITDHQARTKISAAANAEMNARRIASRRKLLEACNALMQHTLLNCIDKDPKFKHIQHLQEVTDNLGKFGVITVQELDFVLSLSFLIAFRKLIDVAFIT